MPFIIKRLLLIAILVSLGACTSITSLMFYPLKNYPGTPQQFGLEYQVVNHQAFDGTQLHSWWLPAQSKAKGNVVFLHGNAQNIGYHQFNVHWLAKAGYNVFLLGYRQYGASEGQAMLPDIFMDVHAGLDWVLGQNNQLPTVLLGQSMGASLAVYGLASYAKKDQIQAVVLDAAFDSYAGMAAEAMSRHWLTWLLQLPALAITRKYDPINWIDQWGDKPLLMFHSPDDETVPYARGRDLYQQALEPKEWVDSHGAHISTFLYPGYQDKMLAFMAKLPN